MAEKRVGSSFLTMFVPGLVLGIIVGGIAGAFLTPVIESGSISDLNLEQVTIAGNIPHNLASSRLRSLTLPVLPSPYLPKTNACSEADIMPCVVISKNLVAHFKA